MARHGGLSRQLVEKLGAAISPRLRGDPNSKSLQQNANNDGPRAKRAAAIPTPFKLDQFLVAVPSKN
jgi:hypothetical protein